MKSDAPPVSVGANTPRPRIWLLDDSPMEAAMARRALAPSCDVEVFTDGSTLLETLASSGAPTVIVLDLQMPGMSGIEVCRFLRAEWDEVALPILMLTVYGHKSDLLDGLAAGANDYVTKPYDASELVARVSTLARVKTLFEAAKAADEERRALLARERAAREEAEAANAAKDGFLAMVSHELRTPLNAILGWTRLLRDGGMPVDKKERALETIERNAVAQTKLIDDLLDMGRVLGGNHRLDTEPVELVAIVSSSVDAVRPIAEAKQISVKQIIHPDGGRTLGDPARLQQILTNVLGNAVKFSSPGGIVTATLESIGDVVEITIRDTGRGIDPSFLPHVFDRFRQEEEGPRRSRGGLGLGLAIVKHLVGLHGGTVAAESEGLGMGALFRIRLPRMATREPSRLPAPHESLEGSDLVGLHLLVVDDDPDAVDLLATLFRRHGATVDLAHSVAEALTAFAARSPDVLVSDIAMPVEDGHELIRRIRAFPPDRGGKVPALALTAFTAPDDRRRTLAAGFDKFVTKPPNREEVVDSVATLAGRPRLFA